MAHYFSTVVPFPTGSSKTRWRSQTMEKYRECGSSDRWKDTMVWWNTKKAYVHYVHECMESVRFHKTGFFGKILGLFKALIMPTILRRNFFSKVAEMGAWWPLDDSRRKTWRKSSLTMRTNVVWNRKVVTLDGIILFINIFDTISDSIFM